ncbi:MAG: hypothetical protein NZ821_07655 [Gloeomargarita sp. SKYB31]|nr:hypothetical protein [Gloeomargarita sp. SKYB31]
MDVNLGAVMIPGGWAQRALVFPKAQEIPSLGVAIFPSARKDYVHLPGADATGASARYWDIHGFVWYYSGGMLTLNRGMKRIRRTVRGVEDVARRRG